MIYVARKKKQYLNSQNENRAQNQFRQPHTLAFIALVVFLYLAPQLVQARTIEWEKIVVSAKLDKDGGLSIQEDQTMIFNGDWNGGERFFRVEPGQYFELTNLLRFNEQKMQFVPLEYGRIDLVDHYSYGNKILRWRSRLQSDPVFNNKKIRYRIDSYYSKIIQPEGDHFLLNHDFAFPDRSGDIFSLEINLEVDPSWGAETKKQFRFSDLRPGQSAIVRAELRPHHQKFAINKERTPTHIFDLSWISLILVVLASLFFYKTYKKFELKSGRLLAAPDPGVVNEDWLVNNIFSFSPEQISGLWFDEVNEYAVGALLNNLCNKKKLELKQLEKETIISRANYRFKLLVPIEKLSNCEKLLLAKIFFDSRFEITTEELRDHIQNNPSEAFGPISLISNPIEKELENHPQLGLEEFEQGSLLRTFTFISFAFIFIMIGLITENYNILNLSVECAIIVVTFLIAQTYTQFVQKTIRNLKHHMPWIYLCSILPSLVAYLYAKLFTNGFEIWTSLGLSFLGVAISSSIYNLCKTKNVPSRIKKRIEVDSAKMYFEQELSKERPNIKDEWASYLMALGLTSQMDSWQSSFRSSHDSQSYSTNSGIGSNTWTGGGGAFSGAGASDSWTSCFSSISASVSTSSSPSGGSSSGGGGGGGW